MPTDENFKNDTSKPHIQACGENSEEPQVEKELVKVRIGLFFDGTANNKTNTDMRLLAEANKKKSYEELNKKEKEARDVFETRGINGEVPDEDSAETSYDNDYTNVVRLQEAFDSKTVVEKEYIFSCYVEGSGTIDKQKDDDFGLGFGTGDAGMKEHVEKITDKATTKIKNFLLDDDDFKLEITLDVFGFSRGATAARNFIHQAINNKEFQKALKSKTVIENTVKVHFAGIYDTVASHGPVHWDDNWWLDLDAVKLAKKVVHICAADEYRENFSLIKLPEGCSGEEIFLPGVHADIGGSYTDDCKEQNYIVMSKYLPSTPIEKFDYVEKPITWPFRTLRDIVNDQFDIDILKKDKEWLTERNWYKGDDLKIFDEELIANRSGIRNTYSYIPLHMMAEYALKEQVNMNSQRLHRLYDFKQDSLLKRMDEYIRANLRKGIDFWIDLIEPDILELRYKYCHFPAIFNPRDGFYVNIPRIEKTGNRYVRRRKLRG